MAGETKAEDKELSEVLSKHYKIDYYQREYVWEKNNVVEMLDDFLSKFNEYYQPSHQVKDVITYGRYFLGSYIISAEETATYIIDGQQRLTTLTLVLMALSHIAEDMGEELDNVKNLVYSSKFKVTSFNISVEGRDEVMESLLQYKTTKTIPSSHEFHNLSLRYQDILNHLRETVTQDTIQYFYEWLVNKVMMVQISAQSEQEAYTIFETMNDRGKPLTSLDMFKGYALSLIEDREERAGCQEIWKTVEDRLSYSGVKMERFVPEILISKFVSLVPGKKSSYGRGDWTTISKHCHRWFRDNRHKSHVNISTSEDVVNFIKSLDYYSQLRLRIKSYIDNFTPGYEAVSYYGNTGSIPYHVLMSMIDVDDPDEKAKLNLMASFMDYRNAQNAWNSRRGLDENTEVEAFNRINTRVRKNPEYSDVNVLAWELKQIADRYKGFDTGRTPTTSRSTRHKQTIYMLLSRMTTFLELADNRQNPWDELMGDKTKHEIEHVLAASYEKNVDTFSSQEELDAHRDKIGALGLLPKSINASLSDKPYEEKVEKYREHNRLLGVLSKSLYREGTNTFENHPGLEQTKNRHSSLEPLMRPYESFGRNEIELRTELFRELAKIIWDPEDLIKYTSFATFDELKEYADFEHDDEFETELESSKFVGDNGTERKKAKSNPITSNSESETVGVVAIVKSKISPLKTVKTEVYGEANHEGKVKLTSVKNMRLDQDNGIHLSPSNILIRDEIRSGTTGTLTKNDDGTYNWEGTTKWVRPSVPLGAVRNTSSDISLWERQ